MDDHKSLKAYTRVKKGNVTLFRFSGFIEVKKIMLMLKTRNIRESVDIEHLFVDENKLKTYALYIIRDNIKRAAVFPCSYCQNNKK